MIEKKQTNITRREFFEKAAVGASAIIVPNIFNVEKNLQIGSSKNIEIRDSGTTIEVSCPNKELLTNKDKASILKWVKGIKAKYSQGGFFLVVGSASVGKNPRNVDEDSRLNQELANSRRSDGVKIVKDSGLNDKFKINSLQTGGIGGNSGRGVTIIFSPAQDINMDKKIDKTEFDEALKGVINKLQLLFEGQNLSKEDYIKLNERIKKLEEEKKGTFWKILSAVGAAGAVLAALALIKGGVDEGLIKPKDDSTGKTGGAE